jgi:hypothetical protein
MKQFLRRGTTVLVGASVIALSALIAAPARAEVTGTVSPERSPAGGPLPQDQAVNVTVSATSTNGALQNVTLNVGGKPAGSASFVCSDPCTSGRATFALHTTDYVEGVNHLVATLANAGGETSTAQGDIEIWNNRPNQCPTDSPPNSCNAQLSIGSDPTAEPAAPGPATNHGGGVQGANETSCRSPRLSMSLSQKPLRVSHGVPVLLKNKRYRFTGRLTCLVGNKRRSAPKGTRIQVRNTVHRKTVSKPSGKVGSGGKIRLILKYPSSRTIEFRFTNADHKTSKVRIKVRISQRKR